jgi:hypothetical protein
MPQRATRSTTAALTALVAAFALLLCSFGVAGANAALSHSAQLSKARGQASFFCYAWSCTGYARTSYSWTGTRLKTTWHLTRPRHMLWHADCTIYANMVIYVNSAGTVSSGLVKCD